MSDIIFDVGMNTDEIKKKNKELEAEMSAMAKNIEGSGQTINSMADKARDALGKMADKVPSTSDKIKKEMLDSGKSIRQVAKEAKEQSDQIDSTFKRLSTAIAGYMSVDFAGRMAMRVATVRGTFQQMDVAFNTMLGSKEKADKLMEQVVQLAATTPFTLEQVGAGAKQLLAYQVPANEVIETLTRLGNVAAGLSVPIDRIILVYGQVKAKGRLMGDDLRQFTEAGIPIIHELAKELGATDDKISKMVESGQIKFKDVQKVFENLTNEGGMFYNMMESQSKTVTGMISNLHDAFDRMLNDIGQNSQGTITSAIQLLTNLTTHYEDILNILKLLVATYGAYKAAVIAMTVVKKAELVVEKMSVWAETTQRLIRYKKVGQEVVTITKSMTAAEVLHTLAVNAGTTATKGAIAAQVALRAKALLNPYALAIAGVAAIVATLTIFIAKANKAKYSTDALNKSLETYKNSQGASQLINKYEELTKSINSGRLSTQELQKKNTELRATLSQLSSIMPGIVKGYDAQGNAIYITTQQMEKLNRETERNNRLNLEREKKEAYKKLNDVNQKIKELSGEYNSTGEYGEYALSPFFDPSTVKPQVEAKKKKLAAKIEQAKQEQKDLQKSIKSSENSLYNVNQQKGMAQLAQSADKATNSIKKLKKEMQQLSAKLNHPEKYSSDKIVSMRKKWQEDDKQLKLLTGKSEKETEKDRNGRAKKRESRIKKEQQQIYNLGKEELKGNEELADKQVENEQKLQASRLAIMEDGAEKRKKEAAVEYQNDLKDIDAREQDYIASYNKSRGQNPLLKNGKRNPKYETTLPDSKAKQGFDEERKNALTKRDNTTAKIDEDTAEEIKRIWDDVNSKFNSDLKNRITQMNEYYDDQEDKIRKNAKDEKDASNQIAELEKDRKAESIQINTEAELTKLSFEQQLEEQQEEIMELNVGFFSKTEQRKLEIQKKYYLLRKEQLEKLTDDNSKKELATINQFLSNYDKLHSNAINKDFETNFENIAGNIQSIGNSFSKLNGTAGQFGDFLSAASGYADDLKKIFSDTSKPLDKITAGIDGIVGLVSIFTSSAKARKEAEKEYYDSIIAQQREYNELLNDQTRLQYEQDQNVFVKDYEEQLKDGAKALTDANSKYQETLLSLQRTGKALAGKSNTIDWAKVGEGAGSGAAVGAAAGTLGAVASGAILGSAVPVVGTIIGALAGGIVGLFAGKKKKNQWTDLTKEYGELITTDAVTGQKKLNVELAQTLINQKLIDDETSKTLQNAIDWEKKVEEAKKQLSDVISDLASSLGSSLQDALVNAFEAGTDAAKAFKDTVSKSLESILDNLVFSQIFQSAFTQLQDNMTASFSEEGDQSWTDDFAKFFSESPDLIKQYQKAMNDAKAQAKANGFDLWDPTASSTTDTSMQGAIKQEMTEETAGKLEGTFRSIRDYSKQQLDANLNAANHLVMIEANTARAAVATEDTVNRLDKAISRLDDIAKNTKPSQSARDMGIKL